MESILTSVKKMLGIAPDYTHFDMDIVMHINSVFLILNQLGVGPKNGFFIVDETALWTDYIPASSNLQAVKSYLFLKVRLLFDPPISSAALESANRLISEFEWRLSIAAEEQQTIEPGPSTPPATDNTIAKLGEAMLGYMKLGYDGT